jgi:hypothetical protein
MSTKNPSHEGGAGWSGILLTRASRILDTIDSTTYNPTLAHTSTLPTYDPSLEWGLDDPDSATHHMLNALGIKVSQPSYNHKSTAWGCELLRAVLSGNVSQTLPAISTILTSYFPRELSHTGLWGPEQGCPDPHGGQQIAGVALTLYAALHLRTTIPTDLQAQLLLSDARQLLHANASYLLSLSTPSPDLTVYMPAASRAPGDNITSYAASAFLRELMHVPHQLDLSHPSSPSWSFPNYIAVRTLRMIRARWPEEAATWATFTPGPVKVKYPVDVYRSPTSYYAIMQAPMTSETVLYAGAVGAGGKNKYVFTSHNTPPAIAKTAPQGATHIHHSFNVV